MVVLLCLVLWRWAGIPLRIAAFNANKPIDDDGNGIFSACERLASKSLASIFGVGIFWVLKTQANGKKYVYEIDEPAISKIQIQIQTSTSSNNNQATMTSATSNKPQQTQ